MAKYAYEGEEWGEQPVIPAKPALWVKVPVPKKKHHDLKPEERLRGAQNGGRARASALSPERRSEIARQAGRARQAK
jgi:hypothetical protein